MVELEQVLQIHGCSIGDTVFSLDPKIAGEQLHWNTTRIDHDARAGRFGPPIRRYFATWPKMSAAEIANIDWQKVAGIMTNLQALHMPGLAVDLDAGLETHRHIVEGNHRICAREKAGLPYFEIWIVPRHLEAEYRVTFRNGAGKPITFPI